MRHRNASEALKVRDLVAKQFGGKNSELAARIAGTSDRKSLAYKAAIREVQRAAKGDRTLGPQYRAKVLAAADKRTREAKALKSKAARPAGGEGETISGRGHFTGEVHISGDHGERELDRDEGYEFEFDPFDEEGELAFDAWGQAYGFDNWDGTGTFSMEFEV